MSMYFFLGGGGDTPFHLTTNIYVFIVKKYMLLFTLQVNPMHCACINPNVKYLEKLLSVEPDYTIEDKYGRKPIHFAAACQGTGPLELLLQK